jgi:hypothetical protein
MTPGTSGTHIAYGAHGTSETVLLHKILSNDIIE